jgi:MFS family permease
MTTRRRRTTTRPRTTRRRRTSTASTLGTAVGAALAGVLTALLGGLAWWAWVLLIAVGLVVGLVWAARRGRAIAPDPAG